MNLFKKIGKVIIIPVKLVKKGVNKTMQAAIAGIIRHLLTTLGGAFVSSGLLSGDQLQDAIGAILVLFGVAWSIISKKKT